jgi:hypothetical protein
MIIRADRVALSTGSAADRAEAVDAVSSRAEIG